MKMTPLKLYIQVLLDSNEIVNFIKTFTNSYKGSLTKYSEYYIMFI